MMADLKKFEGYTLFVREDDLNEAMEKYGDQIVMYGITVATESVSSLRCMILGDHTDEEFWPKGQVYFVPPQKEAPRIHGTFKLPTDPVLK